MARGQLTAMDLISRISMILHPAPLLPFPNLVTIPPFSSIIAAGISGNLPARSKHRRYLFFMAKDHGRVVLILMKGYLLSRWYLTT
jgi:hypothetical protein